LSRILSSIEEYKDCDVSILTYMKIGGVADFLVRPPTLEHLIEVVETSKVPVYPIGKGSNVIMGRHIAGKIVVTAPLKNIDVYDRKALIKAECGAYLGALAGVAKNYSLSGLEYVHQIPGTLGGGIYMNCGFMGHSIGEVVKKVYAISPRGELKEFDRKELKFGHRYSIFQTKAYENWVILKADLQLEQEDPKKIEDLMNKCSDIRKIKHPWGEHSCGCVFINESPNYLLDGRKVTADWLIKNAGFAGWKEGSIFVSPKYAPFFINKNGDHDIEPFVTLLNKVYHGVLDKYGIALKIEVKVIPPMDLIT
jgi:UDP-N-acetylmuramate dehydrogenase